jgi:dUTP pyrophosphatase
MKLKRLHPHARIPSFATPGSACFDLYACTINGIESPAMCDHGMPVIVGTGWAMEVPSGWSLMIYGRSGLAFKSGIRLANAVGVVDADFRQEIMVKLVSDIEAEDGYACWIKPGDRIAQGMLIPVQTAQMMQFVVVDELDETSRTGGFGSSGV